LLWLEFKIYIKIMIQIYLIIQKEKNNRIVQALCKVNIWLGNLIYAQNYNYS